MEPAGAVRARDPLVLVGRIFNCGSRKTLWSMEAYRIAVVLVRKAERYHCIYVTMNLRLWIAACISCCAAVEETEPDLRITKYIRVTAIRISAHTSRLAISRHVRKPGHMARFLSNIVSTDIPVLLPLPANSDSLIEQRRHLTLTP